MHLVTYDSATGSGTCSLFLCERRVAMNVRFIEYNSTVSDCSGAIRWGEKVERGEQMIVQLGFGRSDLQTVSVNGSSSSLFVGS